MNRSHPEPAIINRNSHLILLALVTLLAAGLRCYQAGESLWVDELHTAWSVSGDVGRVAARARLGNQSPLYFYLPWGTTSVFGMNEPALRLPSLLAGIALVPLAYGLVYGWTTSRGAALLTAILTALDRDLIFYSQEARPYALVQLAALVQIASFWKLASASTASAKETDSSRAAWQTAARVGFVLGTTAMIALHYTAVLLVVAELVFFAFLVLGHKSSSSYSWLDVAIDLFLSGFFCLPIIWHVAEVFGRRELWRQFVDAYPTLVMLRLAGVYLLLPLALVGAVGTTRRLAGQVPCLARVDTRAIALAACWLLTPAVIAWLTTYFDVARLFLPRYLMASLVALPIGAGLLGACFPSRLGQMLFALIMIAACVASSGMVEQFRHDRRLVGDRDENWRAAALYIADARDWAPLPVLLCPGLIEDELLRESPSEELLDYCRFPVSSMYRLDDGVRKIVPLATNSPTEPSADDRRSLLARGGAWILVRGSKETAQRVVGDVVASLKDESPRIDDWQSFGELHVVRIRVDEGWLLSSRRHENTAGAALGLGVTFASTHKGPT